MNSVLRRILVCGSVVAVVAFCAPAEAAYWSGTAPSGHFTYDNGHDLHGGFGTPVVTSDDKLKFTSAMMSVTAEDGGTDHLDDTVLFDVHILPGFNLTGLEVRVYGDYLVQGAGSQIDLHATLTLEEFADQGSTPPGPRTYTDDLTPNPISFPLVCVGPDLTGTYNGIATVDISTELPGVDNDLHISCRNVLDAVAAEVGVANLNLFFQQARFEIGLIPEPATLAMLALGALALLRRR